MLPRISFILISFFCLQSCTKEKSLSRDPPFQIDPAGFSGKYLGTTHYTVDAPYYNWFSDTLYSDSVMIDAINDSVILVIWKRDSITVDSCSGNTFYFHDEFSNGASQSTLSGSLTDESLLNAVNYNHEFVHGSTFNYEFSGMRK